MIIPFTWVQYLKAIGVIAAIYYVIVLTLFFRNDIKKLLSARHRKRKDADNNITTA